MQTLVESLTLLFLNTKAVVYTHVNGDTHIENSKNHKHVILPISRSSVVNVLMIFAVFDVHVAINM